MFQEEAPQVRAGQVNNCSRTVWRGLCTQPDKAQSAAVSRLAGEVTQASGPLGCGGIKSLKKPTSCGLSSLSLEFSPPVVSNGSPGREEVDLWYRRRGQAPGPGCKSLWKGRRTKVAPDRSGCAHRPGRVPPFVGPAQADGLRGAVSGCAFPLHRGAQPGTLGLVGAGV